MIIFELVMFEISNYMIDVRPLTDATNVVNYASFPHPIKNDTTRIVFFFLNKYINCYMILYLINLITNIILMIMFIIL